MGPRGKKPLLDQQVKDQATLKVLKSEDPDVEEILGSASHVTLYGFDLNEQAWVRAPSPLSRSPGGRYACPFSCARRRHLAHDQTPFASNSAFAEPQERRRYPLRGEAPR